MIGAMRRIDRIIHHTFYRSAMLALFLVAFTVSMFDRSYWFAALNGVLVVYWIWVAPVIARIVRDSEDSP